MNKKWQLLPLCNVATITMGLSPEGSTYNNDGIGVPLLNGPTEFGPINPECTIFTTDSKRECLPGDLIFCVRGSTTGRMNWADQVYSLGRGVCAISGETIAETKYIKYCLDIFLPALLKVAGGSTMPNLNKDDIADFKIPYSQDSKEIAAILSTYDDLIENNIRRIALLEKMAEEVYREWFVRLRFPGYAQVPVHQGVPEGWVIMPADDAFNFTGGGTPSKEEKRFWESGDINWYTPTDITAAEGIFLSSSGLKCTEEGLANSSARLFPAYSLMMTSRATIGAIGINTNQACTNQGFITCIPNENFPLTFLYFWLKSNKSYFEALSTGSTFLELIKSKFRKIEIIKPPHKIVEAYNSVTLPMFRMIETLLEDNRNLKNTRDKLLSRLLSGKLDVENLDIRFPLGMREMG